MAINSITAYWDNDFDRRFDEAVDELERLEKEKKEGVPKNEGDQDPIG